MTVTEFTSSLRELADFYDKHPEVPIPETGGNFKIYRLETTEETTPVARAFGEEGVNRFDSDTKLFHLERHFGVITLDVVTNSPVRWSAIPGEENQLGNPTPKS